MAAGHLAHAQRQADGNHSRQAFWHGGDGQANRQHEHLQRLAPAQPANGEHQRTDRQGRPAERLAELIQAALQGGLLVLHRLQHFGDQADLGAHAGADHHAAPASIGNHRAHKGGILAVAQWDICLQVDVGILLHRHRFSRQGGLFDVQVDRFQQAEIGRDKVASLDQDDIAGHQLGRWHRLAVAVAQHLRFRGGQLLQRRQRLFGAPLLHNAQHGVQHHNDQDRGCLLVIAQHCRNERGNHQHDHHKVVELRQQRLPEGRAGGLGQLVGAILLQTAFDFLGAQAGFWRGG